MKKKRCKALNRYEINWKESHRITATDAKKLLSNLTECDGDHCRRWIRGREGSVRCPVQTGESRDMLNPVQRAGIWQSTSYTLKSHPAVLCLM